LLENYQQILLKEDLKGPNKTHNGKLYSYRNEGIRKIISKTSSNKDNNFPVIALHLINYAMKRLINLQAFVSEKFCTNLY
jgi:hypothetical protein